MQDNQINSKTGYLPGGRFSEPEGDGLYPVVFLEGGILFPQNVVVVPGLEGFRLEDLGSHDLEGLMVCVVSKSENLQLDSKFTSKDKSSFSYSSVATIASVSSVAKVANGQFGLVLKGKRAVVVESLRYKEQRFFSVVKDISYKAVGETPENLARLKSLKALSLDLFRHIGSQEFFTLIGSTDDPLILCNLVVPYLSLPLEEKIKLLRRTDIESLVDEVIKKLLNEKELSEILTNIQDRVKIDINDSMKKGFLREQLQAIKAELGEMDGVKGDLAQLSAKLETKELPAEISSEIKKEIGRMEMMAPGSPEYMISYNYLTLVFELPWQTEIIENKSLREAEDILDFGHLGLGEIKERILEYIATLTHVRNPQGQILLLVGPPGVGKTSLVQSIATALNRSFERISLGGVEDVSEIRGHRRTYIGAMPGRVMEALRKAKSASPVILLDEIDKAGRSHKGDLGAALLEVLDPEQNKSFVDHFLSFPFDLSKVIFIATANTPDGISRPLLDRMEILNVSGYGEEEKLAIAKRHLIPKLIRRYDIRRSDLSLSSIVIKLVIRHYTRESGVRMLNQKLTSLARKAVVRMINDEAPMKVTPENLSRLLGKPIQKADTNPGRLIPGVVLGLAYTPYGGEVLLVEAVKYISGGGGQLKLTGSLGDVMKESASTVMSYIASNASRFGIDLESFEKSVTHVHFPEGAVPKDGPSAGVALLCCICSLYKGKPLSGRLAMTGEVTLRGEVLAVGGIKEKVLAAHRLGVNKILIPAANWFDLNDLPSYVLEKLTIYPIFKMEDALKVTGLIETGPDEEVLAGRSYVKSSSQISIPLKKWQPGKIDQYLDS